MIYSIKIDYGDAEIVFYFGVLQAAGVYWCTCVLVSFQIKNKNNAKHIIIFVICIFVLLITVQRRVTNVNELRLLTIYKTFEGLHVLCMSFI